MNEIKDDNHGKIPVDLSSVTEMLDSDEDALREVVTQFLIACPIQINLLKSAINDEDFKNVQKLAHSVKGLALNFRAKKASEIAYTLEKCARDQKSDNYLNLFNELAFELKNVTDFFESPNWLDTVLGR